MIKKLTKMTALSLSLLSPLAWSAGPEGKLVVRFKENAHPYVQQSYAERAATLRVAGKSLRASFPIPGDRSAAGDVSRGERYRRYRLDRYFEVPLPDGIDRARIENLVSALSGNADIERAYFQPLPEPAEVEASSVPDFSGRQGYLFDREGSADDDFALGGVDAHYAWTLAGGDGSGVDVVSNEINGFNYNHVDLPQPFLVVGDYVFGDHDTASAGAIASLDDGFGTTGIAHGARLGYAKYGSQRMVEAAEQLSPGSVMQVGIQYRVDSLDQYMGCGSSCYVPLDYYDGPYDAVRYITQELGVHVVAAAGNGDINLDHSHFGDRFDPAVRDSGSILVGAADPGDGQRAYFSNYGERVNAFSWGWNVTTTGYGGLYDEPDADYTATFSGTSSANPIVAGAVASLQGIALAADLGALDTATMRDLVVSTGYPMLNGDGNTIGTHPDLRAASDLLLDGGNSAPVVTLVDSVSVTEGETFYLEASASDPDGDSLSYQWTVPAGFTLVDGSGATAEITAMQVDATKEFSVQVEVSDGELSSSDSTAVTVADSGGTGNCELVDPNASDYPAWSASSVYTGGDTVSHNQLVWEANYWTQGNEPGFSAPDWTLLSDVEAPWQSDAAYSGGDEVNHEGRRYRAQWWTRGDEPGTADVWEDIGPSDC